MTLTCPLNFTLIVTHNSGFVDEFVVSVFLSLTNDTGDGIDR